MDPLLRELLKNAFWVWRAPTSDQDSLEIPFPQKLLEHRTFMVLATVA